MFCEECGTKNKNDVAFCENCGHKLQQETVVETTKTVPVKEKKPMDKKTKVILSVVAAVAVVFIGLYVYLGSLCTPDKVALKYFKAYAANDGDALYSTLNLEDSTFVSKKILKAKLKDSKEKIKLANYSVKEKNKGENSLSTVVTIKYVEEGSTDEKTKEIKLTKNRKNKWLFFDNWTVDSRSLVAKKFKIYAPTGSTLKIDGVKVDKKYKDEDSYSSYNDTYEIPSILIGNYVLTVKLESGIELESKMNVTGGLYSYHRVSSVKLPKKVEKEISKDIKAKLQVLYDAAIEDKSFDDIKDNFDEDYQDTIKNRYESLKSGLSYSSYKKLKSINFTDIEVSSVSVSGDKIDLSTKIKYKYNLSYKSGDETKDYSSSEKYDTSYIYYTIEDGKYVMTDLISLNYYYSYY